MGFLSTTAKHRKYQTYTQIVMALLILYDAKNGYILKSAFGDLGVIGLFLWTWGIFTLLGMISIGVMLKPFYSAGGKVWTMGGREQFAHARGFTVSFYGGLLIEAIVILLYPGIRQHLIVIFYDGITIALIASLLAAVTSRILAKIIFRKMRIPLQMP